jgi:hypothetical protein
MARRQRARVVFVGEGRPARVYETRRPWQKKPQRVAHCGFCFWLLVWGVGRRLPRPICSAACRSARRRGSVCGCFHIACAAGLQPCCCTQCRRFVGLLAYAHIAARYELRPRTESRAMRGGLTALLPHVVRQPCPYVGCGTGLAALHIATRYEPAPKAGQARFARGLYRPAAARSAAALSVFSQVNSGSSRPKWP